VNAIGDGTLRGNDVASSAAIIALAAAEELGIQRYIAMFVAMVELDLGLVQIRPAPADLPQRP
jgi:hypothetical protein